MEIAFYGRFDCGGRDDSRDHPYQPCACAAVSDRLVIGDLGSLLLARRLLCRRVGNHRLCGRHHGAVRVRGDDAEPRQRAAARARLDEADGVDRARPVVAGAAGGIDRRDPQRIRPGVSGEMVDAKAVGISLFGPYVLAVELASMLLLAGLVVAFHIGREHKLARC